MAEFDPFGVQEQPIGVCPVQSVTQDRSVESRWMGCMDAQLMRAAGQRIEGDAGAAVSEFQHFVFRDRRLSVQGIDRLSGTVVAVGPVAGEVRYVLSAGLFAPPAGRRSVFGRSGV